MKNTNVSVCEIQNPYYFILRANLTEFDMSGWWCPKLNPTFLADSSNSRSLKILVARNAQLDRGLRRDKHGKLLKGARSLFKIDLSRNNLSTLHNDFFEDQIFSLQNIQLNENRFNSIPSSIRNIENLKQLGFKSNSFASFT